MDIEHHIITLTNTHRRTVKMPVTSLQELLKEAGYRLTSEETT
jgi:hypothetical protein